MTKKKVELLLCLIKHHVLKTYREINVHINALLTQQLDGIIDEV